VQDTLARLEQQNAEFALVADLLLALGRTLDPSVIRREVLRVVYALTGASRVRLAIRSQGDRWEAFTLADGKEEKGEWAPSALAQRVMAGNSPVAVAGDSGEPGLGSYLGLPLRHQGSIIGTLEVEGLPVTDRLDDYLHALSFVASAASLALENARLHENVRQANERFQLAASVIRSAIYDWDIKQNLVLWTEGITEVFGYLPEEVEPTIEWWLDHIHPDDRQRIRDQISRDIAANRDFVAEYRVQTRDGRYLAVWNRGRMVRGADGRAVRIVGSVEDITELKRTQEVLAAERERLAVTLRSIGDGMIATDTEGRVVLLNRVAENLTGWTQEEAVGKPLGEVFHIINEKTRELCENPVEKVLEAGNIVGLANHTALMARDGIERSIADSAAPIRDSEGNILGVVLVFRDITEQKRAEEQLRKLSRAVEQSPSSIVITDTEGTIEYVNPKSTLVTGYAPEEAIGENPRILKSGETPPEGYKRLWDTITSGEEWRGEFHNKRKNGELYWEFASISPIKDAEGIITHFVAVKEDITERKWAEAERERLLAQVQRQAAELEATITSMADGVVVYGKAGEIIRMNPSAERILGYSPAERARPLAERLDVLRIETPDGKPQPPEQRPALRALRGETVHGHVQVIHRPPDKAIWVSVSAAPIRGPHGELLGAVLTLTDITELHELEEQREAYIHTVSHDLRNPLAIIQGHAQFLLRTLDRAGLQGPERQSAEAIVTGARQMNVMIQDLVDSARLEAGQLQLEKQPVSLEYSVSDLLKRAAGIIDVERVQIELPADLPPVEADIDRLDRILLNLLTNALKYSSSETSVQVKARKINNEVVMSVADRGVGIAPEDLPHIFGRFYRASGARKAEGIGLGLYVTKMMVEAHGGRIWFESTLGKGSTFYFTLPLI